VSDQDFFFDEEPDTKGSTGKGSKGAATAPAKRPSAPATKAAAPAQAIADDQSTTWAVAALLGVVGLLLGAILGFLLGTTLAGSRVSSAPATTAVTAVTGAQQQSAPQLTNSQVQAGQLPAGHPAITTSGNATTGK
jgi:hypothetical protein